MRKKIKAFAPATVANVSCGFDIFGLALESPGDEVIIEVKDSPGVVIKKITGDNGKLPLQAEKNSAGVAAIEFLNHPRISNKIGVEIELIKNMPLGSGMGSSAASGAAVLFGLNELLDRPFTPLEMMPFALKAEESACGTGHADNIAPSLMGGFVLVRSYDPLDIIKLPVPDKLYCTVVHADVEIMTQKARGILPPVVDMKKSVAQSGNVAGFIAGLLQKDYELLGRSMQDVIVEPVRATLIPYYYEVKNAAMAAGALGCNISGSGPSIFALSVSRETAEAIGEEMKKVYLNNGIKCDVYVSKINEEGSKIVS